MFTDRQTKTKRRCIHPRQQTRDKLVDTALATHHGCSCTTTNGVEADSCSFSRQSGIIALSAQS